MSYKFEEYFPNDFIHLLLAAYSADETGQKGGQCPLKKNQKVCFKQETEIYKFMKQLHNVDMNEYLKNWCVYEIIDDDKTGYLGLILENQKNRQLVLSHRSTNFALSFNDNIKKESGVSCDVFSVVTCAFTNHQAQAFHATNKAVERAKELNYSLSFCGHSLGAWLSELSIYYCHAEFDPCYENVKAVTFDGPGTWEMMQYLDKSHIKGQGQKFFPEQFDITFYLSAPNIVNCMNSHIGIGYRLYPEGIQLSKRFEKYQRKFEKIGASKNFLDALTSVYGHDLKYIIPYFDPKTGKPKLKYYDKINKWPKIQYQPTDNEGLLQKCQKMIDFWIPRFIQNGIGQIFKIILPAFCSITICSILVLLDELVKGNIKQDQFWNVHQFLERTQAYKPQKNDSNNFDLLMKGGYQATIPNDFLRDLQKNGCDDFIDKYLINIKINCNKISQTNCSLKLKYILNQIVNVYDCHLLKFIQIKNQYQDQLNINILRDQIRILIRDYENDFNEFLNENPYQDDNKIDCYFGRLFNYDDNNFVERNALKDIQAAFTKSNIVVIVGPPKFGKTTLAYQYVKKLKDQCNLKVWPFNASDQLNLFSDFLYYHKQLYNQQLTTKIRSFRTLQTEILAKIKNIYQDFVIILDNVENLDLIQPIINETPKHIKILITAINYQIFNKTQYQIVNISSMTEQESLNYINKVLTNFQITDNQKKEIIVLSNGMPQFLTLYVGQFNSNENSLETTQEIYQELTKCQKPNNYSPFIEILQNDLDKIILKYISWLNPDCIELNLILQLINKKGYSKEQVTQSLKMLAQKGLIQILRHQIIKINNSIQEDCRRQEQSQLYLSETLYYFFTILPDIESEKHNEDTFELALNTHHHARNIIKLIQQKNLFQLFQDKFPDLFYQAIIITLKLSVIYQYLIQDYQSCQYYLDLFKSLYIDNDFIQSKNLQAIQIFCINQIKLLLAMGKKEEALKNNTLDIIIQIGNLHETSAIKADAYFSLGIIYQQNEQYELSNSYLEQSKLFFSTYSKEDIKIPKILILQAENYQIQGNYKKAVIFYKKALEIVEKIEITKTLRDIFIMKAQLHYQLGKISFLTCQDVTQTKGYFDQAIKFWKEKLKNTESLEVADFTLNLGVSYKHLKQYHESLEALTIAYEIKIKILQTIQNPQIAEINYEKGLVFIQMNDIKQAEVELIKAKQIMLHSNDFKLKSKIEFQLAQLCKLKNLEFEYIYALEELIQKNRNYYAYIHPSLSNLLQNLADAYANYFHDYAKQTELYQQLYFITILHENQIQSYKKKNLITGLMEQEYFSAQLYFTHLKWYQNQDSLKIIYRFNNKYFDQDLSRILIQKSGIISKQEFEIKKCLQTTTLNYLREYISIGKWKGGITGWILYGAKDYITIKHLKSVLGHLFNDQNLKIALMLCFEAINIGIVQSNFLYIDLAQKFMETIIAYPNMNNFFEEVIECHPEYFIDGKILKSLTVEKNYLRTNLGIEEKYIKSIGELLFAIIQRKLNPKKLIYKQVGQLIKL